MFEKLIIFVPTSILALCLITGYVCVLGKFITDILSHGYPWYQAWAGIAICVFVVTGGATIVVWLFYAIFTDL